MIMYTFLLMISFTSWSQDIRSLENFNQSYTKYQIGEYLYLSQFKFQVGPSRPVKNILRFLYEGISYFRTTGRATA
jgi:hypothetical protein